MERLRYMPERERNKSTETFPVARAMSWLGRLMLIAAQRRREMIARMQERRAERLERKSQKKIYTFSEER